IDVAASHASGAEYRPAGPRDRGACAPGALSVSMRTPLTLLRAGVTVAVMWLVLRHFGTGRVLSILVRLDIPWLVSGSALAVAQLFVIAWRWQTLCGVLAGTAPLRALLLALGRSVLLGQFLPATIGAD